MMWFNNSQIPTNQEDYDKMEQVYNNEIFWKVNLEKDKQMWKIQEEQEAAWHIAI